MYDHYVSAYSVIFTGVLSILEHPTSSVLVSTVQDEKIHAGVVYGILPTFLFLSIVKNHFYFYCNFSLLKSDFLPRHQVM